MTEGLDIAGEVNGLLTALRPVERRGAQGIVWLCKCECGGLALRTVGHLNRSRKSGQQPACLACCNELRRGAYASRHQWWLEVLASRLAAGFGLWTEQDDRTMTDDIREAVAERLGFYPREEPLPDDPFVDPSYFDWEPDVRLFAGPAERCVAMMDMHSAAERRAPLPDQFEAALARARAMRASQEDTARAIRSACFFSRCGGDTAFVSLNALTLRWNCKLETVERFVDRGLPTNYSYELSQASVGWKRSQVKGTLVPRADHWLVNQFTGEEVGR